MSKKVARLYEQFQPQTYDLLLFPNRATMTFRGQVRITGQKRGRPSQRLTFHQHGLKITNAQIIRHDKSGDSQVTISRINLQNSLDEVRLHSEQKLMSGAYTVTLDFEGVITKQMDGIYPCNFKHGGQDKQLIATQFESHDARKAFPCIDEPEAKATFDLHLITPKGETVIANTPIKTQVAYNDKTVPGSALLKTSFQTTPRMSTYLLAFAYGELGYSEATTKDGVTVRAYATPDNVALTTYGLAVAVRALEFFRDYFGIAYPLPKLDMLALPDFSSGAMENWGLVTYRETTMLINDASSSIESKQLVALVICHELSHQWFGNLVTMRWWNDLWLNESFANLMEHRAVDTLFPEWHIWETFVSTETAAAKRRDYLNDVQPIRVDVKHPDEISTLFDPSIVYAKGGSVLYMLLCLIGEEAFRAGLTRYFAAHAYSNTTADDLWAAFTATSHQDIKTFMAGWLNRPGYPRVAIDWQPGSNKFIVQQSRFLADPEAHVTTEPWQVPLATTSPVTPAVLTKAETELSLNDTAANPLLFNHEGHSYYLPQYLNANHFRQLIKAVTAGRVGAIDRLQLLDSCTILQRGGQAKTTDLLDLLSAYASETNENVWGALAIAIAEVRKLIEGHEAAETKLNTIISELIMPTIKRLGWDDQKHDTPQDLRLRSLALSLAAGAKTTVVLTEAKKRFAGFTNPADLAASSRSTIYFVVVRYGSQADFEKLLKLHNHLMNADEREELAASLTAAKQPKQYERLLAMLTGTDIRRQDLLHWYIWLLRNRYARTAAWQWLLVHWDWVEQELRGDKSYSYFARYAGSVFSKTDELKEYVDFFKPKAGDIALSRAITLGEQEIRSRVAWRQRNEHAVLAWFKDK